MTAVAIIADHDDRDLNRLEDRLAGLGVEATRLRLGISEAGWDIAYELGDFLLKEGGQSLTSEEVQSVRAVIYRRWPMVPVAPITVADGSAVEREFAEREWREGLENILLHIEHSFPHLRWANPASRFKDHKQWMLSQASRLGVTVPATFIGTRLDQSKMSDGRFVAKAIGTNEHLGDGRHFPTSSLSPLQIAQLTTSRTPCPSCVQEYIEASHELRLIVAYGEVIALKITTDRDAVDIRLLESEDLAVEVVAVEPTLGGMLRALTNYFGLEMCSYDVLVDEAGVSYLVDITPNGSWWFFEDCVGDSVVSDAVAKAVVRVIESSS